MWPVSSAFLAALSSSQEVSVRADLLKGGQTVLSGLPVTGGSVSFTRSSATSRQLSCTLTPRLTRADYLDESTLSGGTLGVYGHEVRLWWQLHYIGGGVESVPLCRCRIDQMSGSLLDDDQVQISGVSREAYVADAAFVAPRTLSGPSARSLIGTLIREVLGSAEVVVTATRDARVPAFTVESDRWGEAIKTLADSIAATVRCDASGRFVVADAPTITTPPAWRVAAGKGGVLVKAGATLDRARVRNAWIVQGGSPSSDSAPIQAVVYDTAAGSPTRWGDADAGAFGMVPEQVQVATLTSLAQCKQLGLTKLAQTCGAASTLDLSMVPNPALEVGDVIDVITDPARPAATVRRHIVDSGSIDLTPGGAFSLSTRDLRQVGDE